MNCGFIKKALLLFSLTFVISIGIKAQAYHKMLGQTNVWSITTCLGTCITDTYIAIDDTIVNGLNYKFLDFFHFIGRTSLIREDTIAKKIYIRPLGNSFANQDVLLYNFSLNVGDTTSIYNPNSPLPNYGGVYKVDSITTVFLLQDQRKKFFLSEVSGSKKTIWIEGIGSQSLLVTSGGLSDINNIGNLSCFYRDNILYYSSDTLPNGPCDLAVVSVTNDKLLADKVILYPNPTNDILNIEIQNENNLNYKLFDATGRLMMGQEKNNSTTNQIDVSKFNKGVYFIELYFKDHKIIKKIIKI